MDRAKPMLGKTFGYMRVLSRLPSDHHGKSMWDCQCACGTHKACTGEALRKGRTKDCGCMLKHRMRVCHWQHGYSSRDGHSEVYTLWLKCRRIGTVKEWADFYEFFYWAHDRFLCTDEFDGTMLHPFKLRKAREHTPMGPKNYKLLDEYGLELEAS